MRREILRLSIFLPIFIFALQCFGQVTITQSNYPRPAMFTDSIFQALSTGVVAPSEGPAQVWDYSNLVEDGLLTGEYLDAAGDADFPNALNYRESSLSFQGFLIPIHIYEAIDASGFYTPGQKILGVTHSISFISGGLTDSIGFPAEALVYDGRINYVKFPMTYQDQWTNTSTGNLNFELTVGAFGLNKTPGHRKRELTRASEIVGYGQLRMPTLDGSSSAPMDALLLKIEETSVDSFFLAGSPAPQVLLDAFGLIQGETLIYNPRYIFYRPDAAVPLVNVNLDFLGDVSAAFFRPRAAEVTTYIRELAQAEVSYFPNPAQAGHSISIETENFASSGFVRLYDLTGRLVHETPFNSASGHQFDLEIPANIGQNIYACIGQDQNGNLFKIGKLQIK